MTAPIVVVDFELDGARPSARDVVARAVDHGARFVALDVVDGDDETPDAHVDGRRVAKFARFVDEATRREIGLFLRVRDTLVLFGLRETLGVAKGSSSDDARGRVLVVVPGERVGKRLRREAPELPSALEVPAAGRRGLARFLTVNMLRAAADADDLVVPWNDDAPRLVARIAPSLAMRGARVWASGVREEDAQRAAASPVAGFVVRRPYAAREPGV